MCLWRPSHTGSRPRRGRCPWALKLSCEIFKCFRFHRFIYTWWIFATCWKAWDSNQKFANIIHSLLASKEFQLPILKTCLSRHRTLVPCIASQELLVNSSSLCWKNCWLSQQEEMCLASLAAVDFFLVCSGDFREIPSWYTDHRCKKEDLCGAGP